MKMATTKTKSHLSSFLIVLAAGIAVVMSSCEPTDGPIGNIGDDDNDQTVSCISGLCVDLSSASAVDVNYETVDFSGTGGEVILGKFTAEVNAGYAFYIEGEPGFEYAIVDSSIYDPGYALHEASFGYSTSDTYTFVAEKTEYYFYVKLGESDQASGVRIRVVSPQVNVTPNDASTNLVVNSLAEEYSLIEGEYFYAHFSVIEGHTYNILGRASNGTIHVYTGLIPFPEPEISEFSDAYGDDALTFQADYSGHYFIGVYGEGQEGIDGRIQVFSTDENLTPLGGEANLTVNGLAIQRTVLPGETKRFVFSQTTGIDYSIDVTQDSGTVHLYLSEIPSVDDSIYALGDLYCDCNLSYRATRTGNTYLAVMDDTSTSGSTYWVSVSSN